jgi:hypothetical protein
LSAAYTPLIAWANARRPSTIPVGPTHLQLCSSYSNKRSLAKSEVERILLARVGTLWLLYFGDNKMFNFELEQILDSKKKSDFNNFRIGFFK